MNARDMLAQLESWVQAGWIRPLDQAFAAFLAREAPDADALLLLGAALASHQLARGHACLDLQAVLRDAGDALALPPEQDGDDPGAAVAASPADLLAGVDLVRWQAALRHPRLVATGADNTPLVLEGGRLYLRRYWQHEQAVHGAIVDRLQPDAQQAGEPTAALREGLAALFPRAPGDGGTDWQQVACALAVRQRFAIVTGGPGTGKTTTVVTLLALLQHLALAAPGGRRLRIRLAAPTGKAAARLNESIAGRVQGLALQRLPNGEAVRAAIPTEVTTVHRLLGSLPDTRHFRHHARNPLPLDVLVLDEASMVDLEMMAAVLQALPASARLVLLGDKDQLASVEAGAVLGALCRRADGGHYTPATRDWLRAACGENLPAQLVDAGGEPLDQAVVKLRVSHRFSADSGIGQLAEAVNAGSVQQVRAIAQQRRSDLTFIEFGDSEPALRRLVLQGPQSYRHYLELLASAQPAIDAARAAFDSWARQVLDAYGAFQLLAAVRKGPQGVERLNQRIASMLHAEGLTDAASGWYLGRPVMVTRNDYGLGLMNGDVGITLARPVQREGQSQPAWKLRVAFASGEAAGGIHWVLPSRLQAVETVFAMTVHKSQGSEFAHAALVLPDRMSRVLTRELVYTGITRARQRFTLATTGDAGVLEQAVQRRLQRAGGPLA
jgi:exodeoxyribonuclease V alpha subunit